jgi:hypothetical protein
MSRMAPKPSQNGSGEARTMPFPPDDKSFPSGCWYPSKQFAWGGPTDSITMHLV